MTPENFVKTYLPFAMETQNKTGISALAVLAQAALESGWGEHAPGNMFFGVKDFDGINGNEKLIPTFEFHSQYGLSPKQIGLANITSIKPVTINGKKMFKYIGQAYFKKYDSPEESFTAHAKVFHASRYAKAMEVAKDPVKFVEEVAKAGYAQSPRYADVLKSIIHKISAFIQL